MSIRYGEMPLYSSLIYILEFLGGSEPTEDEVWEVVRESDSVPNFDNILYDLVFLRIKHEVKEKYPKIAIEYFINDLDTHFYINGTAIYSLENFKFIIEQEEQ